MPIPNAHIYIQHSKHIIYCYLFIAVFLLFPQEKIFWIMEFERLYFTNENI